MHEEVAYPLQRDGFSEAATAEEAVHGKLVTGLLDLGSPWGNLASSIGDDASVCYGT